MPFPIVTQQWAEAAAHKLHDLLFDRQLLGKPLQGVVHHGRQAIPPSRLYGRDEDESTPFQQIEELSDILNELPVHHRTPKKERAWALYHGLRYSYGFAESLETGNWVSLPGECSMVNCYNQAIATFAVAKAAGLEPALLEFIGFQPSGRMDRAGHGLVVVNVAEPAPKQEPEYWVIDQAWGMYGPVQFDDQSMAVENFAARQLWRTTHQADFRRKEFGFIQALVQDEEAILAQVSYLREHPKAVLYSGQRIGFPKADAWQSQKPIMTGWFLKFDPAVKGDGNNGDSDNGDSNTKDGNGGDSGVLVSRLVLNRPGIKSRGLEYQIHIGQDNSVTEERVVGYYCSGSAWSDLVDPIPLVTIPAKEVSDLVKGLSSLPLEKRATFELDIMHQRSHAKDNIARVAAANASYAAMQASDHRDIVWAISAVEALYQQEKGGRESYLTPGERQLELKKLARTDATFKYYQKLQQELKKTTALKQRLKLDARYAAAHHLQLLQPDQLADRREYLYGAMDDQEELLDYLIEQKPMFIDDAVDRMVFYNRRIRGKEDRVEEITRERFGDGAEEAVAAGYRRIFAEFLGHMAMTEEHLLLRKYKKNILEKICGTGNTSAS